MIGVIADDLTGAAELGARGIAPRIARGNHRENRKGPVGVPQDGSPNADLICVDTDSRSCTAAEAGRRAAAAAKQLAAAGAKWIYKKVDSVLARQRDAGDRKPF